MNRKAIRILSTILAITFVVSLTVTTAQTSKALESFDETNEYINQKLTKNFHDNFDESLPKDQNQISLNTDTYSWSDKNTKDNAISYSKQNSPSINTPQNDDEYEVPIETDSFRYKNGHKIPETNNQSQTFSMDDIKSNYNPVTPSGQRPTANAIDVSKWQGNIDWQSVKNSGQVDFAILRLASGFNIHKQGDNWNINSDFGDTKFKEYADQCNRLGIPIGAYFFSYADTVEDAKKEAQLALKMLDGVAIDYPIYYDLEDSNTTGTQSKKTIAQMAKVFNDTLSSAGYQVGIYANKNWFTNILTDSYFDKQRKWVAQYNSQCNYNKPYEMWQYTSRGSVSGINGDVDLNFWYGDAPNSSPKISPYVNSKNNSISVTVNNINNAQSVSLKVWTSKNGQDDVVTYNAKKMGLKTWSAVIPISKHNNEGGEYNIECSVINADGTQVNIGKTTVKVDDIIATSVIATHTNDINSSIDVSINGVNSTNPLQSVDVAIWSQTNGQDDLIWYTAKQQSNGKYFLNFKPIDHKLSTGTYYIHVYATDVNGLQKMITHTTCNVSNDILPVVTAITNYNNESIDINITSKINLNNVLVPVWSDKNGQDDIIWYNAKRDGQNTWSLTVNTSNHNNDNGIYYIHCYSSHNSQQIFIGNTSVIYEDYSNINISTENINDYTGEFKVILSNICSENTLDRIDIKVWSDKNGKDDLITYQANKDTNNNYSITVNPKNHKNDSGVYNIESYLQFKNGVTKYVGSTQHNVVINPSPNVSISPDSTHSAINVTVTNLLNAKSVSIPVWSDNNGQDDIIWHSATKQSDGSWTVKIPISQHNNETGKYMVHGYYTDNNNQQIGLFAESTFIDKITTNPIVTTVLDNESGLFKVILNNVKSPSPIKNILVPIWSNEHGQDDIIWYNATYEGNNTYSVTVDPRNHKNNLGIYYIDIYGTDSRGFQMFVDSSSHNVTSVLKPSVSISPDISHRYILVSAKGFYDAQSMSFPTWTDNNGQDDIIWHSATKQSDGTWTAKIPISEHNNETGTYIVHGYYTDNLGNLLGCYNSSVIIKGITAQSISVNPISNSSKFTVFVHNVSSPAGINYVQIPVWSANNGQDDLIWYRAKDEGNGNFSIIVDPKNHKNDSGTYYIDTYATDNRNITEFLARNVFNVIPKK